MKTICALIISLLAACACSAQDVKIVKTDFTYDTFSEHPSIIIEFKLSLPGNEVVNDDNFLELNSTNKPELKSLRGEIFSGVKSELRIKPDSNIVSVWVQDLSPKQLDFIRENAKEIFIFFPRNISMETVGEKKSYTLAAADIKNNSLGQFKVTSDISKQLIDAKGGTLYAVQNKIDFGISPAENTNTGSSEYFMQFAYRANYNLKSLPVFFFAEGLLSTNSTDSLNFLSIYPINVRKFKTDHEFVGQLGVEGNQQFSNYRVSGNFYWQGLLPNLVDLTMGEDRLRLKPVFKGGIKLYQEIKNNRPVEIEANEFSNQLFTELYYYIPIKEVYSLTLQGTAFYDFNEKVNPDKEVKYYYSAILGIEIPKTGVKTIFKYMRGENGISYQKDEMLMIGLMADLFTSGK